MTREPSQNLPVPHDHSAAAGVLDARERSPEELRGFAPSEPPAAEAPPSWFRGGPKGADDAQSSVGRRSRRRRPLIETAVHDREPTFLERLERWMLGAPGLAYLLSMLFHAALLTAFGVVIYRLLPEEERGTLIVDAEESEQISLDEVDMAVEIAPVEIDPLPAHLRQVPAIESEVPIPLPDDLLTELPKVGGEGTGEAGGRGLALPKTRNAVTRGSFTAWTIPEDPEPRQRYIIVVEVKLPDKIRRYRTSDLSGMILGTDDYDQRVPLDSRNPLSTRVIRDGRPDVVRTDREFLPITDNRVQLLIEVPGAERLVKDRIQLRSRILKERQDLEITF